MADNVQNPKPRACNIAMIRLLSAIQPASLHPCSCPIPWIGSFGSLTNQTSKSPYAVLIWWTDYCKTLNKKTTGWSFLKVQLLHTNTHLRMCHSIIAQFFVSPTKPAPRLVCWVTSRVNPLFSTCLIACLPSYFLHVPQDITWHSSAFLIMSWPNCLLLVLNSMVIG
jgi:hypothetical protein